MFDSNKKEIGVRITENTIVQAIVHELGNPIASSSLHNEDEPILDYFVDPYAIFEKFENQVSIIIDGGQGKIKPSTVINCIENEPVLIRQGAGKLKL
jgi:tRNA A37 threonylcarbamoyladenosine synthetase subunit TsaC/SUA5/YrdC